MLQLLIKYLLLSSNFSSTLMAGTQYWVKIIYGVLAGIVESFNDHYINFDMIIRIKKVSKDVKYTLYPKIFKRNLFIGDFRNDKIAAQVLINEAGLSEKDVNNITSHPTVVAETTSGEMVISNLTSSLKVNGKATIKVGGIGTNLKTGGESYFVRDLQIIKIHKLVEFNNNKCWVHANSKDFLKLNFKTNELANNIGNIIESITGKELKNKNLELIKDIKPPIDKN